MKKINPKYLFYFWGTSYSFDKGRSAKPVSEAKRVTGKTLELAGTTSTRQGEKIHHLKARKTSVTDDGGPTEMNLGELARLDMKGDSSKIQLEKYVYSELNKNSGSYQDSLMR